MFELSENGEAWERKGCSNGIKEKMKSKRQKKQMKEGDGGGDDGIR